MPNSWTVDLRHFLDDHGLPVVQRGTLVPFLGAIVEATSAAEGGAPGMSEVRCRRRPGHRRCPGLIHGRVEPDTEAIVWSCPVCGDDGHIANWQGTPWDRRPTRFQGVRVVEARR